MMVIYAMIVHNCDVRMMVRWN